jgi:uncharacterized caspase-like protein
MKRDVTMQAVMRALLSALFAALWLMAPVASEAAVEKRVALVIGNGLYKNTVQLPNAPNDARAMSASLRRMGFQVVEGIDLSGAGMTEKLREFSGVLIGADVGLVFYAGHGLQVAGENYLVPVDALLKQERDLDFETLKVDLVVKQLMREAKVKILLLDACRDNPLATDLARSMGGPGRTRSAAIGAGLGKIETQGASGALVAFATAPGTTALDGQGQHSPFTEALLGHLETPGLDIGVVMTRVRGQVVRVTGERQQPWTNSSLTDEFYMVPAAQSTASLQTGPGQAAGDQSSGAPQGASPARGVSAGFDPRQMEFTLWQDAKAANTPAAFQAYLDQFPVGTYAGLAREAIGRLGRGPAGASSSTAAVNPAQAAPLVPEQTRSAEANDRTEVELALDEDKWQTVQRRLTRLGFGTRGIDGTAGAGTRAAIRNWQTARGMLVSGYLNKTQYDYLLGEPLPAATALAGASDDSGSTSRSASKAKSESSASRSEDRSESRSERRASRGSSGGNSDAGDVAGAAGRFIGGAVRGFTGGKLGF